ncbi:MAG: glycerol-3-phosphate 1-O-acyltransferase PlsY [Planctomycetota bacterium]|nr:glycerol-3-phosphate 1-O-acyltransferase PlsY [Planctomycetota bacterium]
MFLQPSPTPFLPSPLLSFLGAYLLGSISFALLLAKIRGVNLREIGSGNLGATNAGRALGPGGAVLVYLLDALKGFLPAWFLLNLAAWDSSESLPESLRWTCAAWAGFGAWCGHVWPIYHKFKGGKGVATLSGAFLALQPMAVLIAGIALAVTAKLTRFMSVGSLVFGISLPVAVAFLSSEARPNADQETVLYFALIAAGLTFWTHRTNIARLLKGEENPVGNKS